ncbi:hypothetical protein [Sporolactobacillus sp. KGMB 08714]|uniref:hypothetical protein n=1 Tax=Sporolactobacillus sp. KGMB 08714 TaxID=3064704 RepID=UPI002FBF177E
MIPLKKRQIPHGQALHGGNVCSFSPDRPRIPVNRSQNHRETSFRLKLPKKERFQKGQRGY